MPKKVRYALVTRQLPLLPPGLHADGAGLYLQVAGIARTWVYRFQMAGRRRDMGLGPFPDISLAKARELAHAARELHLTGVDPIEDRRAQRGTVAVRVPTFAECADRFLAKQAPEWSSARHVEIWRRSIDVDVLPVIGKLRVDQVDDAAVLRVLEPIWTVKPDTASRVRGRIENVLDWAKAAKHRAGENPARWRGHLALLLPKTRKIAKKENFAALPYAELPALWPKIAAVDSIASRSLRFLILTAARTGEVLGATWDEIDMDGRVWTIGADRMKAGKAHRVPLSDPALAILREMATIGTAGLVFPGRGDGKPQTHSTMTRCLENLRPGVTVHGFRSTFRDWAAETGQDRDLAEMALAHTVGGDVERRYRRTDLLDMRRALATAWAAHCGG